jgi:hypothetical protein
MKISKAKLRQIIKEELYREDDAMRGAERPGPDIEGYPNPEEEEDPMASQLGTEKQQLLSRILARAVVDRYASPAEIEHGLGLEMTPEMTHFIQYLQSNPMFGSSGVKEGKVSGHRSEVTYSKEKRGKSKKPEKKAYNKADRAQAKRELKK